MKLHLPDNIFTHLLFEGLVNEVKEKVNFLPSSILSKTLNDDQHKFALIPTLKLITNKDLFVSKSIGISFEGPLSNSFIYYEPGLKEIVKLKLSGDFSFMEFILSKIISKNYMILIVKLLSKQN